MKTRSKMTARVVTAKIHRLTEALKMKLVIELHG
jgi:hypothetical protein